MEVCLVVIIHPSYNYIRLWHQSVRRQSEPYPSRGLHLHCKPSPVGVCAEVPVESVVVLFERGTELVVREITVAAAH